MKKIRLSLFWVTLACILTYVHISLVYDDAYGAVFIYVIGFFGVTVFLAFAFNNIDKIARDKTSGLLWSIFKIMLTKVWYWVLIVFITVFVFNFLRSLIQLFEDKGNISQKIVIFNDPFMGQMFVMILSFILSVGFIRMLYIKMKKN